MKFQRNYRLTVETNEGGFITIEPPLTIEFDIKRNTSASVNTANIRILNLSKRSADLIFQDRFNPRTYKRIVLEAGYGDTLSAIFIGNIFSANTVRSKTELVTNIDARDGGFDTSGTLTNKTVNGQSVRDVILGLSNDFENVRAGVFGDIEGEFKRPVVLNGNTFDIIRKYTGDRVYIDLEQINVLKDNEALEGVIPLINTQSGLLETPKRENAFISLKMIFEPKIIMGQVIEIESSVNSAYDGQYKVIGVQHTGTISEAVGGNCETKLELLVGSQIFGEFNVIS